MGEDEDAHRMSVRAGYVPDNNNRRNSDLGRGYESMERLTERMSRELVLKEAKRLELEKEAVESERKRKALEVKYESSLQDQIRMQMRS